MQSKAVNVEPMERSRVPPPAKLIGSIFAQDEGLLYRAAEALVPIYGLMDWQGPVSPFTDTAYYEREFGPGLKRVFVAFRELVDQDVLARVKSETQNLERLFSRKGKRCVNIDPGILTAERVVLATHKNFTHRIYLKNGVFADLTLIYQEGSFRPLPWTYPDYASREAIGFWNKVRGAYLARLAGQPDMNYPQGQEEAGP